MYKSFFYRFHFHALLLLILSLLFLSFQNGQTFREKQMSYSRVKSAYEKKEAIVLENLKNHQITRDRLELYIRAFKSDQLIELWARNRGEEKFKLIRKYPVCSLSGKSGPKRRQGDLQIPEGFYKIDRFNPWSNFHLSLGVNYPNKSDRILGQKDNPGGDIFIHGNCVTIGCLPITDELIQELYIYCVEAKNNGMHIPVSIFPSKMTDEVFMELKNSHAGDLDKINLWTDLKKGFDIFNETNKLPAITFLSNGRHKIE